MVGCLLTCLIAWRRLGPHGFFFCLEAWVGGRERNEERKERTAKRKERETPDGVDWMAHIGDCHHSFTIETFRL